MLIHTERHNHTETFILAKVSRRTQKLDVRLAKEELCLAFFRTDWGHIFASNFGNHFGFLLRGNGRHKPVFAYGFVRTLFLMI